MDHRFGPVREIRLHEWGAVHVIFMIVVLALLVLLAVWLATNIRRQSTPIAGPPHPPQDPALTEARMRYARGEISREDFLRITGDLSGAPPPGP